ncbi:hypothetical protein L1049_000123 [Liquidambar formosana]|uniref:SWIM-type domain-containing protein n=1 Tax=Liquidambar formosana TaxID=63359 RepID=A0AAP0NBS4_LIQFO
MLFVDGTFLKSRYKGQLLAATAKDGNQGLFPLAFAVVDAESEDNWRWFFENLREIVGDARQITFISDRNNGLRSALPRVFPTAYYAYCLHHLKMNLQDKGRNKCNFFLMTVLSNAGRTHTSKGKRYGEMCSNVAESFNAWIKEARFLPITNMVDLIRSQIMALMCNRRLEANSWNTVLYSKMDEELGEELDKGITWRVSMSSDSVFEVHSYPSVTVDILNCTCTCYQWQINGFPCSHAAVTIQASGGDINDYVEDYFYTSSFREAYSQPIHPISIALKVGVSEENFEFVLPPTQDGLWVDQRIGGYLLEERR